jgi:hypothetical protein
MSCSADDDDDDVIMCHSYSNCYCTTKMPYGYKHNDSYMEEVTQETTDS